jgi:hypothetical protein
VVRLSRDRRRLEEAAEEQRRKEQQALAEAAEREEQMRRKLRRVRIASLVFLLLTVAAAGATAWALRMRSVAEAAWREAEAQRIDASTQRDRAQQAYKTVERFVVIRQAILSGDRDALNRAISMFGRNRDIQFRAEAIDLKYKNPANQDIFEISVFPNAQTLPKGEDAVAFMTYMVDHPTFRNKLISVGPDRGFRASYTGWGCLTRVFALIEYKEPAKEPSIAEFNMCEKLGW